MPTPQDDFIELWLAGKVKVSAAVEAAVTEQLEDAGGQIEFWFFTLREIHSDGRPGNFPPTPNGKITASSDEDARIKIAKRYGRYASDVFVQEIRPIFRTTDRIPR